MFGFLCRLFAAVSVIGATSAAAEDAALLVGVSDYAEGIGLADLRGPANDVILMRDVLAGRGFAVTALADGVPGAGAPTRAVILAALDDLAAGAGAGDLVYIHLSGHGTRQRDENGDESDGLDEVFLPADTARALPGTGVLPNAIVDDEIGAAVDAIRATGADVWLVLDTCHSGSGLRAGGAGVAARFADPVALGLGQVAARADGPAIAPGAPDLPGRYLAFYAAESSEVAREVELEPGAANGWYGLFTAKLAARLGEDTALSYRQLFQAVLQDMNGADIPSAARMQTPGWEGDLIDAPVFGGGDVVGVRQFAVDGGAVRAGRLHGITEGTLLALVDDAGASADEVSGWAQAVAPTAVRSDLRAVGPDCLPEAGALCPEAGPLPAAARYARLEARPLDPVVTLSPPRGPDGAALPEDDPLQAALRDALAAVDAPLAVTEGAADIEVSAREGALWFGPAQVGAVPMGLAWRPGDGALAPLLARVAAAETVARMLDDVGAGGSMLFPSPVTLSLIGRQGPRDGRGPAPDTPQEAIAECRAVMAEAPGFTPLPSGPDLAQCDQVALTAEGAVPGPARDVNRIYIDSQYCVAADYVRLEGVTRPAPVGDVLTLCSDCPTPTGLVASAGAERVFVVVTEAEANAEALDLRGLIENCAATPGPTRSGTGAARAADFLAGLGAGRRTRGAFGGLGLTDIWVERIDWTLAPRAAAFGLQQGD